MAKSNCNKCIHSKMCKYNGITADELLKDLKDKYDFIEDVEFTCKYFEKPGDNEKPEIKVSQKTTEKVNAIKQTVITDSAAPEKKQKEKKKDNLDEKFASLSVFSLGFDKDVENEFTALKMGTMKDVYAMSYKLTDESRNKINAKLEVFNQKKI